LIRADNQDGWIPIRAFDWNSAALAHSCDSFSFRQTTELADKGNSLPGQTILGRMSF
jgi:hypothetical protein